MTDAPAARPVGIRRSTRYLPEVECLRGVAIMLVFALHLDGLVQPFPGRAYLSRSRSASRSTSASVTPAARA